MIELAFLVILVLLLIVPFVLYQALSEQNERAFFVLRKIELAGGPYRGHPAQIVESFELPSQARGAVAFSFLFSVLGLLLVMPTMIGLVSQWGGAWLMGLPGLGLAMAASVAGIKLLRQGPGAAALAGLVGFGQFFFGAWLLAVVMTVTDAQYGPVSGPVEETVARTLFLVGGQLRGSTWALPFSAAGGFGLLPVLYGTASLLHGALLLLTSRSLFGLRLVSRAEMSAL